MNATDDYNFAMCLHSALLYEWMLIHLRVHTRTGWTELWWTVGLSMSMPCNAMGWDVIWCDGLTSVWPYTSLNSIGYVCTSYGGCWMTPTSVVWLFWHTQDVSVVVISVSVCAQAVIAAAYMQQPSTSLLRAYANEWVNERTDDRKNKRPTLPTNEPTNQRRNQPTN